jgi:hypothetical protein
MGRYTIFVDISGRLSREVRGASRVTAAAVAIASMHVARVAKKLGTDRPKWRSCQEADAVAIVQLLRESTAAVGVFAVFKDTLAWERSWDDASRLKAAIEADGKGAAGFVKLPNVLRGYLISSACAIALGQAVRSKQGIGVIDMNNLQLIERTIVCDKEIDGADNQFVFKALWGRHDDHQPWTAAAGVRMTTRDIRFATEQEEPLLLLADYAAGIAQVAAIEDVGRAVMPLSRKRSAELLGTLTTTGTCAVVERPFDISYEEIFGDAMVLPASE